MSERPVWVSTGLNTSSSCSLASDAALANPGPESGRRPGSAVHPKLLISRSAASVRASCLCVQASSYAWIPLKPFVYYCIPHLKSTRHVISEVYQGKLLLLTVSQVWLLPLVTAAQTKAGSAEAPSGVRRLSGP